MYERRMELEKELEPLLKYGGDFPFDKAEEISENEFWYLFYSRDARAQDDPPVYLSVNHYVENPPFRNIYVWPLGNRNWLVVALDCDGWDFQGRSYVYWKKVRYFVLYRCRHIYEEVLPRKWPMFHTYRCKKCGYEYSVDSSD